MAVQEDFQAVRDNQREIDVRYVPTAVNIPDAGTRGLALAEMTKNSTWQNGPHFLSQPEECWPKSHSQKR